MDGFKIDGYSMECYRGNEVSANVGERPGTVDIPPIGENRSVVENPGNERSMSSEHEERIEKWMEGIREFIRNIDVSRL